jgi:hypothetical protein
MKIVRSSSSAMRAPWASASRWRPRAVSTSPASASPGDRLVGVGQVEVFHVVSELACERQAAPGMVPRRFLAAQQRVDVR